MSTVVEAVELSRWYGIVMGLNNVSFTIEPGITGLVGPNGAGKSTLIQIITGQLRPSSGVLKVFGEEPWDSPRLVKRIGFCPEKEAVHEEFRPVEWLVSLAMLSGMEASEAESRAEEMLERVKLPTEAWTKPMKQFSKGMKQRTKLCQAMMHRPDLIVLDEPMNGLDPMGRQDIAQTLKGLVQEGVSIIISSHILQELESLSKNILILNWGRVLASGGQREIRSDLKGWAEQFRVRCSDRQRLVDCLFKANVLLGFQFETEPDAMIIKVKNGNDFTARWTGLLLESEVDLFEFRSESRSLRNIFDKVTTS
jgi:ABC-2 type transport system ATP-binding protein